MRTLGYDDIILSFMFSKSIKLDRTHSGVLNRDFGIAEVRPVNCFPKPAWWSALDPLGRSVCLFVAIIPHHVFVSFPTPLSFPVQAGSGFVVRVILAISTHPFGPVPYKIDCICHVQYLLKPRIYKDGCRHCLFFFTVLNLYCRYANNYNWLTLNSLCGNYCQS